MIVKPLFAPWRLLAEQSLLWHLPRDIPGVAAIEKDLARLEAGWHGEQELDFYLRSFPDERVRIFYDLRLSIEEQKFQIDTLLLTPNFLAILEAKNYSGTLSFLPDGQLVRIISGRREGFPNPLTQLSRQKYLLKKWLVNHQISVPAIESQVVIANPAAIIDNLSGMPSVNDFVTHAEQIPARIQCWFKKYPDKINEAALNVLEKQLLAEQIEDVPDVLEKFKIKTANLQRGVCCDHCRNYSMQRIYGQWACPFCGIRSQTAHEPMLLDYFLLFGRNMTNRQCRELLMVENRYLIPRLMKKMNIPIAGSGAGAGLYYKRPAHEIYETYYYQRRKNNITTKSR